MQKARAGGVGREQTPRAIRHLTVATSQNVCGLGRAPCGAASRAGPCQRQWQSEWRGCLPRVHTSADMSVLAPRCGSCPSSSPDFLVQVKHAVKLEKTEKHQEKIGFTKSFPLRYPVCSFPLCLLFVHCGVSAPGSRVFALVRVSRVK